VGKFIRTSGFALMVAVACAPSGPYVWADDYIAAVEKEPHQGYLIAVGELIAVRVFGHEELSRSPF